MTDPLFPCPDLASLKKPKKNAVIAVAGDAAEAETLSLRGADYTVCTATPEADDFLKAITAVYADTAFILPNGGDARAAAIAAATLIEGTRVILLPTASHAEVLAALAAEYDRDGDPDEIRTAFLRAIGK